ncbi:MAG TPA: hypothetical protein VFA26_10835 [Gemmataceae bacterium]|nr:hypothetical protein [Gemmataceae bacterium]
MTRTRSLLLAAAVAVPALVLLGIFFFRPAQPVDPNSKGGGDDDSQQATRELLQKETDSVTCRSALGQAGVCLANHPNLRAEALTPGEQAYLKALPAADRQRLWQAAIQAARKGLDAETAATLDRLGKESSDRVRGPVEQAAGQAPSPADRDRFKQETGLDLAPLAAAYRTAFRADLLRRHFQLDAAETDEATSPGFTDLDAHHLDLCFLMRDAAASLLPEGPTPPPAEAARLAFAWTVRQVRLVQQPGRDPRLLPTTERDGFVVPPQFALRRGWGSAAERALVFLALLHQLDIDGCLVCLPGGEGNRPLLWACGAVAGKDLLLFDPCLGLPIPGESPGTVATLAQAKARPEVLKALTPDEKQHPEAKDCPYDVTAEKAKRAEVWVVCPLSGMGPRMRALENVLQDPEGRGPIVRGRLAYDPARLLVSCAAAARGESGEAPAVHVWSAGARALRSFLPQAEGGTDKPDDQGRTRYSLFHIELSLGAMPPLLVRMEGRLGHRMRLLAASPALSLLFAPRMPRDNMLRGRLEEAVHDLSDLRNETPLQEERLKANPQIEQEVVEWYEKMVAAYGAQARAEQAGDRAGADAARAQVDALYKQGQRRLMVLIEGYAADARRAELTYFLALCKHEQAERAQARLDVAARAGKPPAEDDERAARDGWANAAEWWATFVQDYPGSPAAPAARTHLARARLHLGQRPAAAELLGDLSGPLTPLEKTARLYLARSADAKK